MHLNASWRVGPIPNFQAYAATLVGLFFVFHLSLRLPGGEADVRMPEWIAIALLGISYFGIHLTARFITDRSWRGVGSYDRALHWDVWDVLVFAVVLFGAFTVLALISAGAFEEGAGRELASAFFMPLGYLVVIALWAQVVRVRGGRLSSELGLHRGGLGRLVWIGLLAFVAFFPCQLIVRTGLLAAFNALRLPTKTENPIANLFLEHDSVLIKAAVLSLLLLSAPFFEEVLMRGLLYRAIRSHVSAWIAAVASAVLFGALHSPLFYSANILFLGLLLAYLVEKTGSVVPGVTVHFLNNLLAAIGLFVTG